MSLPVAARISNALAHDNAHQFWIKSAERRQRTHVALIANAVVDRHSGAIAAALMIPNTMGN
jgi:hypothetical protein